MAGWDKARRRWRLRTASAVALLMALVATGLATWATHAVVSDQEKRLLKERTAEVNLLLVNAISAIPATLSEQGGVLRATNGGADAYVRGAQNVVDAGPGEFSFAWLRPAPTGQGYVVIAAAGKGLKKGQVITDARARTFEQAMHTDEMVATPVIGADRKLGFALGPPAAPAGTVLYRESPLGPVAAPRVASDTAFAELDVAIYGAPTADTTQILSATTTDLPLAGDVRNEPLQAGATNWLLSVKARRPLVGTVAANAFWAVLGGGLLGALLIAIAIETALRRRDAAVALYASEHQVAETLQRSLLPTLPKLPGLDLAARYLASGSGQQVGGDWFDVFPVSGGRVGVAVGDVIGHDLAAASAMAQIRAALRAYALDGDPPASVITRLNRMVDRFGLTQLVTVVYGVLEPPGPDGSRVLQYTNAGHLPPLVRQPDGTVETLSDAVSAVIGAPIDITHVQAEHRLQPGAALVMFTDGLVEAPGDSLDEALGRVADVVGAQDGCDAEAMCDSVLSAMSSRTLRDDIALLTVCVEQSVVPAHAVAPAQR